MGSVGVLVGTLATIGAIKLALVLWSYAKVILETLVLPPASLVPYGANKQSPTTWAVVTGASSGFGEEFAYQLAKRGYNIALLSRSQKNLDPVLENLKKYNVKAASYALDVAAAKPENFDHFGSWLASLGPVGVLINNVGVGHEMPVSFAETDPEEMRRIITTNNMATLEITRVVLPRLSAAVNDKSVKKGLILNIGSFAALVPTPMLAVYAGSKAFLQGWGSAMAAELKPQNIDVQTVLSYLVTSKLSKIRRTSLFVPDPKRFVASCLSSVGRRGGAQERAYTMTPYWSHALMHWFLDNTLGVHSAIVSRGNLKNHIAIRKRALKKR